jgi:CDP-diacylglycerol--serine O-phosphatidyltransferase
MVVSTVLIFYKFDKPGPTEHPVVVAGIFVLAVLMVSNLKFASFKELDLRKRKPFPVLLGIIVLLILIVNEPQIVLLTIGVLYVLHGPVWSFFLWRKKRAAWSPASPADPHEETAGNSGAETLKEREGNQ